MSRRATPGPEFTEGGQVVTATHGSSAWVGFGGLIPVAYMINSLILFPFPCVGLFFPRAWLALPASTGFSQRPWESGETEKA